MMYKRTSLIAALVFISLLLQSQTVSVPYSQFFNDITFPAGWIQQHESGIPYDDWYVSDLNAAGGLPNEMHATWIYGFGTSRLVTPPIATDGISELVLSFRHLMSDYAVGTEFLVQSSANGTSWTDENWLVFSGSGTLGPEQVTTTITHNLGSTTYLAFAIRGDHYQFDGWDVDDVEITIPFNVPVCTSPVFPQDNAGQVPTNADITWTVAPHATDYYFYLGTDNPPSDIVNGVSTLGQTKFSIVNLQPSTQYYWKVIPMNSFGQPDDCDVWSFTTLDPYSLPFTENFSGTTLPYAWIERDSAATKGWYINLNNIAGGIANELRFDYQLSNGISRFISPPIQTAGESVLTMKFKTFFKDYSAGMSIKVQTSTDAIHWTNEDFIYSSGSGNLGPQQIILPLYHNLGSIMYVAFVLEGNLFALEHWYIDDVEITAGGLFPGSVSGSIRYDNTNATLLSNVTVYLQELDGSMIDSSLTGLNGQFQFNDIPQGDYQLSYAYSHNWGGTNSVDALLAMRHFANMAYLSGVRLLAADVNNSGNINSIDALLIMRRFTSIIDSFVTGDWCFDTRLITIPPNGNIVKQIKAVCFGDVNGSFNP